MNWFPIFAAGFLVGWWMCVATWPRFTRRPPDDQTRQAFTEGRTIRGNGNGGPTTPKPQFLPGRVLGPGGKNYLMGMYTEIYVNVKS